MSATSTDEQHLTASTQPHPPRYWWLKRILLAAGVLIVALAALRWWWGYEAERRLQAKIDEYHALGQPVTIEDFQYPSIPDEQNAAHFLMKAHAAIVTPPDVRIPFEAFAKEPALAAEHPDDLRRVVEVNAEALRLVRVARSKPRTDWGIRMTSPVINILLPHLSCQRQLARLCCVAGLNDHVRGDDESALERVEDALNIGQRLMEPDGLTITLVVSQAISDLATRTLEAITPELRISGHRVTSLPTAQCPERHQVVLLIEQLLDEEVICESWRRAVRAHRLECLDFAEIMATRCSVLVGGTGGAGDTLIAVLFGPMYRLDAVRMMDFCVATEAAGLARAWPTASARAPELRVPDSLIEEYARSSSAFLGWGLKRTALGNYRVIAHRRMAATALAIRLYELDHGQRPPRLEDLVPDYLPKVPADPFAADGRALGYRLHGPQPLLYSVGKDGVNEGGEFALDTDGDVDWEAKDIPFFLNGDRPRPQRNAWIEVDPNSPEAVDDDR